MLLLNPILLVVVSLVLVITYVWKSIASPLRTLPGSKISLFTSWILKYHEFRAYRTRYIHRLHQRYGSVVRVAPNEVSFASLEGVKEIYGSAGSGYDKTEFYDLFRMLDRRTMFSTLNKEDHAKRKRILADRYANTNILKPESINGIRERSRRFIERCSKSIGDSINIYICLHDYAFDCATHHLFHPYGSDSLRIPKDEETMKEVTLDDSLQNRLVQYYSPTLHKLVGGVISLFATPRSTPLADNFVMSATAKTAPAQFTLINRIQDKGYEMDRIDMASECLDHMVAGIDTTGDALCFLMWEISQPGSFHFQRRLQKELLANPNTPFDKLPYLDALVLEGLRCFPAIPMSLPRYVPSGGRTIDGFFVPQGTIVSCQAYSAHRIDESVFPQPDTFDPDRWLQETGELDRKRLFFAFASGGRGCIGKHLALAEMKVLLRDMYSRFTSAPDPSMTARDMEMSDQIISSQPKARRCLLRLIPLES
ncbi:cytochrome P450 3A13 [Hypoxylon trugodes]|uniref:cytochrome P450 3A13 n=1 Tax=Hypoxylon trugodes TaxID=326681 RepID=UPI00219176FA|nr:cytochrome P450 3A13 [Hypoxylon trugodes]KAI1393761.1 cytochrome P450 3A13 [Hypoxylon trugodes]